MTAARRHRPEQTTLVDRERVTLPAPATGEGTIEQVLAGEARWAVVCADCLGVLPTLPERSVDHSFSDFPYSRHQHESVRSSGRNRGLVAGDGKSYDCNVRRTQDLGFAHLSPRVRRVCARETARVVRRWSVAFSDVESSWLWRTSYVASGLQYVRTMHWIRLGGAPQFTGDRPAAGCEAMTLVHPRGRKRWNGGGKAGIYTYPIVLNHLGERGSRVHPTQKPEELMGALIEDFSDPGDLIGDWTCGSGTTGVAALRLGRRFIGIERESKWAELSRERLRAEESGSTLQARRAGQRGLFEGTGT